MWYLCKNFPTTPRERERQTREWDRDAALSMTMQKKNRTRSAGSFFIRYPSPMLSSSEETLCEKHPHAKTLSGILCERASRAENRPDVCPIHPTRTSILFLLLRKIFYFYILFYFFDHCTTFRNCDVFLEKDVFWQWSYRKRQAKEQNFEIYI